MRGFWGDKAHDAGTLREGDKVAVSINVESREYNGRWFTEARGWKMTRMTAQPPVPGVADMPPFAEEARPTPASRPMTCLSETAFRELSVGHSQQDR